MKTETLDQPCRLCEDRPVRCYVKTKAGFVKVCQRSEKVLKNAGILIQPEIIRLMVKKEQP